MTSLRSPLPTRPDQLPELPPAFFQALRSGLGELGLADLDPAAISALADHARLLLAWTVSINLTAIRDPTSIARAHVLDSLAAVSLLVRRAAPTVLDLGSGGGYPGLPLAIALSDRRFGLVESSRKKARFLTVSVEALGLAERVDVYAVRAEALGAGPPHRGSWSLVVARAVAPLAELAELAFPLLRPGGYLVAWKQVPFEAEVARAERILPILGAGRPSIHPVGLTGLEGHVLIGVEKVGTTPGRYPRAPAARRSGPRRGGA